MRPLVIAIIAVVVLLLIAASARARYENYLGGLWVGDPGFLESAGLGDVQLFIGPRGPRRSGYLLMANEGGEVIANQAFELGLRGAARLPNALRSVLRGRGDTYRSRATFDFDADAVFPEHVRLSLSILDGSLTIYDSERVYAYLVKDMAATAAATAAYED